MNTKPKIIAFILVIFCAATPIFASASTGPQPFDLLASVSVTLQGALTSLYGALSTFLNPKSVSSTSTTPITNNNAAVSSTITLKLGQKSVMVTLLQWDLIADGYLKGPATGVFGTSTQAAVEALQKAKNLPVTGYLLMTTSSVASSFARAASPFTPITVGATGTMASALQKSLVKSGNLNISTTTSYFGTLTQAAVKKFQASHQLPQTGIVDQTTFAAMNRK
jgi:peptidoglycan hydrolase-like protein with peptidoglycan-binding domain